MSKTMPKVRFEGYSEEWEEALFGDLYKVSAGFAFKRGDYVKEGVHIVNGESIQHGEVFSNNWNYLPRDFLNEYEDFILKTDDIVLGLNRPITNNLLKIAKIPANLNNSLLYQRAGKVNFKTDSMSKLFSYQIIENEIYEFVKKEAVGSDQPFISTTKLEKWRFFYPVNLSEQQKIGTLFKQLDNTIALQQQLVEQQQQYKKAMVQKMFPQKGERVPKVRFDGFSGDWESIKLKELGHATGGTSIESEFNRHGKYKVISIGSYSENSKYTDQGIRVGYTEKTRLRILNKDDLTMILNDKTSTGRIIGRVLLIEEDNMYVYNQRTERIEINKSKYSPLFLYHYLNSDFIRMEIVRASQGNTQIYVNWSSISEIEYLLPKNLQEQQKIGDFFKQLDDTIALHEKKLEDYQQLKKALLQRMFV